MAKASFIRLHSTVTPLIKDWVKGLESMKSGDFRKISYEDGNKFEEWLRVALPDKINQIKEWFAEATSEEQQFAKGALIALSSNFPLAKQLLENPFLSPQVISQAAGCFPGSAAELVAEGEALKTKAALEKGNIKGIFTSLFEGNTITTYRVNKDNYGSASETTIGLPLELKKITSIDEQGRIVINLQEIGVDKVGLVIGAIRRTLQHLNEFTGAFIREEMTPTFIDQPAEKHPEPSHPLLESDLKSLLGKPADLQRYPSRVQAQIDLWKDENYAITTLIAPTGTGKTYLARELTRQLANISGFVDKDQSNGSIDDVVLYRFNFGITKETVAEFTDEAKKQLGRDTYKKLLKALHEYLEIVRKRPDQASFFIWDDFDLIPFTDNDSVKQELRELGTHFKTLGERFSKQEEFKKKKGTFGVFFIGEEKPDGIDESFIHEHRFKLVRITPQNYKEQLEIGKIALSSIIEDNLQKTKDDIIGGLRKIKDGDVRQSKIDQVEKRFEKIEEFLLPLFIQYLNKDPFFSSLTKDKEALAYFTNAIWDGVAIKYISIFEDKIKDYLNEGSSSWFKGKELQLTKVGRKGFEPKFQEIIGEAVKKVTEVASQKLRRNVRLSRTSPQKELMRKKPKPDDEGSEHKRNFPEKGKSAVRPFENLDNIIRSLSTEEEKLKQETERLKKQAEDKLRQLQMIKSLKADVGDFSQEIVMFLSERDIFSNDLLERLRKNDQSIFTKEFRQIIASNIPVLETMLSKFLVDKPTGLNIIQAQLPVLKTLLGDDSIWESLQTAQGSTPIAASILVSYLKNINIEKVQKLALRSKENIAVLNNLKV